MTTTNLLLMKEIEKEEKQDAFTAFMKSGDDVPMDEENKDDAEESTVIYAAKQKLLSILPFHARICSASKNLEGSIKMFKSIADTDFPETAKGAQLKIENA